MQQFTKRDFQNIKRKIMATTEDRLSLMDQGINNAILEQIFNDKECLEKLQTFTSLGLSSNNIQDISPLARLTNLTSLDLSSNQIQDISPLARLTNLKYLNLSSNKITNMEGVSELVNLEQLYLNYNHIKTMEGVSRLAKLEFMNLSYNDMENMEGVSGLVSLQALLLNNNKITEISQSTLLGLHDISSLVLVDLNGNPLSELLRTQINEIADNRPYHNRLSHNRRQSNLIYYNMAAFEQIDKNAENVMKELGLEEYIDENTALLKDQNSWLAYSLTMLSKSLYLKMNKERVVSNLRFIFDSLKSDDTKVKQTGEHLATILGIGTGDCGTPVANAMDQVHILILRQQNKEVPESLMAKMALSEHIIETMKKKVNGQTINTYNIGENEQVEVLNGFLNMIFLEDIANIINNTYMPQEQKKKMIPYIPVDRDPKLFEKSATNHIPFGVHMLSRPHIKLDKLFSTVCVSDGEKLVEPLTIDKKKLQDIIENYKTNNILMPDENSNHNKVRKLFYEIQQVCSASDPRVNHYDSPSEWELDFNELAEKNEFFKVLLDHPKKSAAAIIAEILKRDDIQGFLQNNTVEKFKNDLEDIKKKKALEEPEQHKSTKIQAKLGDTHQDIHFDSYQEILPMQPDRAAMLSTEKCKALLNYQLKDFATSVEYINNDNKIIKYTIKRGKTKEVEDILNQYSIGNGIQKPLFGNDTFVVPEARDMKSIAYQIKCLANQKNIQVEKMYDVLYRLETIKQQIKNKKKTEVQNILNSHLGTETTNLILQQNLQKDTVTLDITNQELFNSILNKLKEEQIQQQQQNNIPRNILPIQQQQIQ